MRKIIFALSLFNAALVQAQTSSDSAKKVELQSVGINALKGNKDAPFAKTEITAAKLAPINTAQDLPMLLQSQVGVQSFSDAGNGVGYTGIRLRGSDITRINVTLNGVPVNDAESQGTFFVNLPDLASSASNIQIQRGAGGSSNGPGAFGGSIHINTLGSNTKKLLQLNVDGGSLATLKLSAIASTGLINNKWNHTVRLSSIRSNGFVRNGFSRLIGGQYNLAYTPNKRTVIHFNYIAGKERTGLAWDGVPSFILDSNRKFNGLGIKEDGTYYDNQTDNYQQHYFQLLINKQLSNKWRLNVTPYYTRGLGFYEEYKNGQALSNYQIPPIINGSDTITQASLVRQLWLNNHLLGINASVQANYLRSSITISGNANTYAGLHYGRTPWVAFYNNAINKDWYRLNSNKQDRSAFVKYTYRASKQLQLYADVQYRNVQYNFNGFRNNPTIKKDLTWNFVNPKAGLVYTFKEQSNYISQAFASFAKASKEPNRDDLETPTNNTNPLPEVLYDGELGYLLQNKKIRFNATTYYMHYRNQLVLTGKVNDVGAYTRTNVAASYRAGLELEAQYTLNKKISFNANAAFSTNRIKQFTEYVWNWDTFTEDAFSYNNTRLAFSPELIMAYGINALAYKHGMSNLQIMVLGKYVGKQYLDNTNSPLRQLNAYHNLDIAMAFNPELFNDRYTIRFNVYNLLNAAYESNGYTFSDISAGVRNNYTNLYPQAGTRFSTGFGARL
jgi:iron complex outermembrane recepter protein